MRWLAFIPALDLKGTFAGQYWALTQIPAKNNMDNAHLPIPPRSAACLAVQPIDVVEMQLPEDIDTAENVNDVQEPEMLATGWKGNTNRRAVPIIIVRYATTLPDLGSKLVSMTFRHFILLFSYRNAYRQYLHS